MIKYIVIAIGVVIGAWLLVYIAKAALFIIPILLILYFILKLRK